MVSVDGFWIDRCQVTNAEFARFVAQTGYVTVAERPLDPADFPGAPAENLVPGSLVFTRTPRPRRPAPPAPVVDLDAGGVLASSRRTAAPALAGRERAPGRARRLRGRARLRALGREGAADRGGVGVRGARRPRRRRRTPGATSAAPGGAYLANCWQADFPWRPRADGYGARRRSARSRPTASACTTWPATCGSGRATGTPRPIPKTPAEPAAACPTIPRGDGRVELRPRPAPVPGPPEGDQGRLVPMRRQLLPALPARRAAPADDRHRHEPHRVSLRGQARPSGCLRTGAAQRLWCRRLIWMTRR